MSSGAERDLRQALTHHSEAVAKQIFAMRGAGFEMGTPPEPMPPPIKEPPGDAPENPDVPVREPDPDELFEI